MFYLAHGDGSDDELVQAVNQSTSNHQAVLIIVGGICLLIAFILLSRYLSQRKQRAAK